MAKRSSRAAAGVLSILLVTLVATRSFAAASVQRVDVPVRGKTLSLAVYVPAGTPKGTVIMGGGDVGWVGLGVSMAEFLSGEGWLVVGLNVRQYLSVFTTGKTHLTEQDPPADYLTISDFLKARGLVREPVIVSGVSEGAALAVLVASSLKNHAWLRGVITMGIPPNAELAWRWSDFTSWITKTDAREPSFAARDYIAAVSPLPLYMLQSKRDEYVTEADYRAQEAAAKQPKRLILIDASNHRFTDKPKELRDAYLAGLEWIVKQPS